MNRIITFEHSKVKYLDIFGKEYNTNSAEFKKFIKIIEKKYKESIRLSYDCIIVTNFVGVIKIKECIIEVLPKMFANTLNESNKALIYSNLYYMINKTNRVKYTNMTTDKFNKKNISIMEYYINVFLTELGNAIRPNMYHTYESKIENRRSIKGKILIRENIKKNLYDKSKNYCKYEEFTDNNLVNQIFKFTIKKINKVTKWSENKKICKKLLYRMTEIDDRYVTNDTFSEVKHDNNLYAFEKVLLTAQMFINNLFTSFQNTSKQEIFIFNFDMNFLFQEYIYSLINENREYIFDNDLEVLRQVGKKYLIYDKGIGKLKLIPDIIIAEKGRPKYIIDTKYKILNENKIRNGIHRDDLFQMNAYIDKYKTEKVILIYPQEKEIYRKKYSLNKEEENKIFGCTINLQIDLQQEEYKLIEEIKDIMLLQ